MGTKSKGSLGVLSGLSLEEDIQETSKEAKSEGTKEVKIKRSYSLPESTIKKLSELKLYNYPIGTSLEDIVNEAILSLYENKHKKEV